LGTGASYGNAGLIVPSYSLPLATKQNVLEGLRSIVGVPSAVGVRVPLTIETMLWFGRFLSSTRRSVTDRSLTTLASLTRESLALYEKVLAGAPASVGYERNGTLYVALTGAALNQSSALAARLAKLGIEAKVLSASEARLHEPTLSNSIAGAVWYPGDAHVQPLQFVEYLAGLAVSAGVVVRRERVMGVVRSGNRAVGVRIAGKHFAADQVVLAAGTWGPDVAKSLGLRVPILPAKGYSVDFRLERPPRTPMLFTERHVSATPMNGVVRATTGLDFHGEDPAIAPQRLQSIRAAYDEYLEAPKVIEESAPWAGFRPLTPDGLPIVGPSSRILNFCFATGHGPLGITLAPVTADLIASAILDDPTAIPAAILPRRFGI